MMERIIHPYEEKDLDAVLTAWESASGVAHPFLSQEFLDRTYALWPVSPPSHNEHGQETGSINPVSPIDQERLNMPELYLPQAKTWVLEQGGQVIGFIPSP